MCASSQMTRSHSVSLAWSKAWASSSRASLSSRAIARGVSMNQLPVRAASNLSLVMISKGNWEPAIQLVLPLLGQATGAHDEAASQITSGDKLLHQQPGHDRLAGPRVICQ